MKLGVDFHPSLGVYAYYLRPCYAKLLDIGASYPIRTMTGATASQSVTHLQVHRRYLCLVMTGDRSSSWNSLSSLHIPTALDKAYDDRVCDTIASRTGPRYNQRVYVTLMIPQVRGLLPYYRSRGLESYRPSLQGFHMTIPASQFSQLDTQSTDPLRSHRRPTSVADEMRHSSNEYDS
ncbi:UNVERIFIED_CONTAM: hypothetical protein Slati_0903300 [Sesamum latifolium]|uniref:Uncharacterized protein n=1 Tax=Sesamum latifolium TaxID=2727402 RepID=A0AAW2XSC9_9LAMI